MEETLEEFCAEKLKEGHAKLIEALDLANQAYVKLKEEDLDRARCLFQAAGFSASKAYGSFGNASSKISYNLLERRKGECRTV